VTFASRTVTGKPSISATATPLRLSASFGFRHCREELRRAYGSRSLIVRCPARLTVDYACRPLVAEIRDEDADLYLPRNAARHVNTQNTASTRLSHGGVNSREDIFDRAFHHFFSALKRTSRGKKSSSWSERGNTALV